MDTNKIFGRYTAMLAVERPNDFDKDLKKHLRKCIRKRAKELPVAKECYVCDLEMPSLLQKHHMVQVADFCHRDDLNEHVVCLCHNCHGTHHRLREGNLGAAEREVLSDRGWLEKHVELDRLSAYALLGIEYTDAKIIGQKQMGLSYGLDR